MSFRNTSKFLNGIHFDSFRFTQVKRTQLEIFFTYKLKKLNTR